MIRIKNLDIKPTEHEKEKASNSYLMSLVGIIIGLPIPIVNLICTLIFFFGNRNATYFVKWHCTQALISQFILLIVNNIAFWWTISIIIDFNNFSNAYFAYILVLFIFNITEFIMTIYSAIETRKGIQVEWWIYGGLTNLILNSKNEKNNI
ncbi:hypothetical protein EG240_12140 [Paenimyroides tangerinum]|uniref:DUF4870 domain-containing protein n=1 Tax=Paenimyroides tangerinum TaxID=2488728 RepID=A0A3P3W3I3_9FLAO|nr:DUF4870 domain-containing protein [Paenimyroides tangerinum]RRJ89304.1 hypothetical protein EG240_12140 [Paenimyroides tangerinum]